MPKDVFEALEDLEFEGFLPRLEAELASALDYISLGHLF